LGLAAQSAARQKEVRIPCDFCICFACKKNFCYNENADNRNEKPFLVAVSGTIKVSLGCQHRGGHLSFNKLT